MDGDIDFDARLDVDVDDLLEHLGRGVQVDQALVDAHLVEIPRLGTFTVGCLTGVVTEGLGRETDGALDAELLLLCAADQFLAHCTHTRREKKPRREASVGAARRDTNGPEASPGSREAASGHQFLDHTATPHLTPSC